MERRELLPLSKIYNFRRYFGLENQEDCLPGHFDLLPGHFDLRKAKEAQYFVTLPALLPWFLESKEKSRNMKVQKKKLMIFIN